MFLLVPNKIFVLKYCLKGISLRERGEEGKEVTSSSMWRRRRRSHLNDPADVVEAGALLLGREGGGGGQGGRHRQLHLQGESRP